MRNKIVFIVVCALMLAFSISVFAVQDLQLDVVDQNFSSSNRVVISEDEIKSSHATNVVQLLACKTNINIFGFGFQPNTIYLRGGDSRHILILIDGIPAYDPGTIQRTANLSNLNIKNIRKIEIIKGSQSVVYGGQALAGVIKIETVPQIQTAKRDVTLSGSQSKFDGSASAIIPVNEKTGVSVALSHVDENNVSPVKNSSVLYPRKLYNAEVAMIHRDNFEQIFKISLSDERNQITDSVSNSNFSALDALGNNFNSLTYGSSYIIKNDELKFSIARQQSQRDIFRLAADNPNPFPFNGLLDQNYIGIADHIHFDYSGLKSKDSSFLLGFDFSNESLIYKNLGLVSNQENQQYESTYFKADHSMNDFKFEAGYRKQLSKLRSINDSYQFGIGYKNEIKLEFSTGYNQPSLTQLYVYNPNPNLKPETAQTATLSYEKKIDETLVYSGTLFESKFENLIFRTGSPSRNENIASARTQGVELEMSKQFIDQAFIVSVGYTYQEPKDLRRNSWLARRPLHIANVSLQKNISDIYSLKMDIKRTGERVDQSGSTTFVSISENTVADVSLTANLTTNLNIFTRINNITDSRHELSYGYFAEGTNVRFGTDFSF